MNAGKAVYGILSANSGVTDIVGTNIFPEIAEQETAVPFVVYQLQSVDPDDTHDGPSKLDEVRFEFLCYADSYNAAADLGVAVRAALDRVSGTYNGVHVESVQFNDVDVNIEYDPRRYSQVLTFTFRIKRDDVTIALGTPVTGAVLGDLSDVDVTGVTNGQLIAYNSTSGNWEAANDAGGAEQLNDLSDVIVNLPATGEVLIYDGGEFVNDNIAISNVTGLQAALDAAPDNLRELTDVTISGLADNDYLQYNSATGVWENSALILGRNGEQYTGNYDSEAETLLDGATETVELYYTAQADGDGLHEDAQSDTATTGYDIQRKLYYAEKAQADPNTSADWTQFTAIADNTTFANAKAALLAYLKERTGGTVPISLKQTWEEVAQAPAFTGLLNETYGSGAAAAYSVRRLNGNYTGAAIQVERSSDNTTQDIGFDSNGDLDESALTTFCTGTTCKVRSWYDQSQTGGTGSGNDAVQTTHANQPTIYTGGAIVKVDGKPAIQHKFGGTSNATLQASLSYANSDLSIFCAYENDGTANQWLVQVDFNINLPDGVLMQSRSNELRLYRSSSHTSAVQAENKNLGVHIWNGSNLSPYLNGVAGTVNTGSIGTTAFNFSTVEILSGIDVETPVHTSEIILYTSDKSTDRTSIESNIGDYFTQNTPLLDTYTGAAAAYSLRKLRTAYSGSAIRVRRASDNTEQDIGFNVFGELDTVSLASFCSGTNGFVKTWYDQASTNDATQTTAANQPKIYDSVTGVVTENGKPAVQFDGSDDGYLLNTTSLDIGSLSSFMVGRMITITDSVMLALSGSTDNRRWYAPFISTGGAGDFNYGYADSSTAISTTQNTNQNLHTMIAGTTLNGVEAFLNSTSVGTDTRTTGATNALNGIGNLNNSFYAHCNVQEVVYWGSDQSTNRTNIESNINTFYSIY